MRLIKELYTKQKVIVREDEAETEETGIREGCCLPLRLSVSTVKS